MQVRALVCDSTGAGMLNFKYTCGLDSFDMIIMLT